MTEVCPELLTRLAKWLVYIHSRPDGSVFYIGKGTRIRAYDLSPSRRSLWHNNIVRKYGRENIGIKTIPCATEQEAFELEKVHIALAKSLGAEICNLCDGGQGVSGRKPTAAQELGLAKGRRKGKKGKPGIRKELVEWVRSEAAQPHLRALGHAGAIRLHSERSVVCAECLQPFLTNSAKAKCCSRLCEQRYRRAGKNT